MYGKIIKGILEEEMELFSLGIGIVGLVMALTSVGKQE